MDELWWRPTWIHGRGHQTPPNISAGEFGFVERSIPRFIDDSGGSFEVLTAQSRCTCSANKTWRVLWRARERKVSSVSSIVREVIDIIDQIYPAILFSRTATNPNSPHLPSFSPTFSQPPSSNLPLLPTQRRRKKKSEPKRVFAWEPRRFRDKITK